jgi:hypothetical protein
MGEDFIPFEAAKKTSPVRPAAIEPTHGAKGLSPGLRMRRGREVAEMLGLPGNHRRLDLQGSRPMSARKFGPNRAENTFDLA